MLEICANDSIFRIMNFLAHAYLSFDHPEILTGNMISDFVKGRKKFDYTAGIQKGIHLHRQIDTFTDFHPVTARAKEFFRPQYRLYSGAFIDIVYDHFLANDESRFVRYGGLEKFTERIYSLLSKQKLNFPEPFKSMFPYMVNQNWLYSYRLKSGMQKSFQGLVHRARYLNESVIAYNIFNNKYDELQNCYEQFFPELEDFTIQTISKSNLMP